MTKRRKIVPVDLDFIHNHLDTDFFCSAKNTDPTTFQPSFYIPEGEFWVGSKYLDEADYLLWVYEKFEGLKGKEYLKKREEINRSLSRGKTKHLKDFVTKTTTSGKFHIITLDGEKIRRHLDCEFTLGGNPLIYSYFPKNSYGHDKKLTTPDRKAIDIHELTELEKMVSGWTYDAAHDYATAVERQYRRCRGAIFPGDKGFRKRFIDQEMFICRCKTIA